MKNLYLKASILFAFLSLSISYGQLPGEFTNVMPTATTAAGFEQNTVNGGAHLDADLNFILAKSQTIAGNLTNVAIINGYAYPNILNDNSGNESVCTDGLVSENNVIVWGGVNATCCDFDVALEVYEKDIFPNALLGESGPASPASITSELRLFITSSNGLGRIRNVIRNNEFLYITVTGFGSGFNYETNGTFGTQTGFISTSNNNVLLRLNITTGLIDQSYVNSDTATFSRGSLTFDQNSNTIYILTQVGPDVARVLNFDVNLNLISTSEDFYYKPNDFGFGGFVDRPILIDQNPPITTEEDSGGPSIILGGLKPDDDKDIIRKIQDGTVVPYNDETTIGSMYFPYHPHKAIVTPEHYVFLRFANNGEGWISFVNKETGSFDYHKSLMFNDSSGNLVSGLNVEDMVYDALNNEIDFVGTYIGSNRYLGGVALPNTSGQRGITFSYKLGIPSEAEVNLAVVGYPNAEVSLDGNHFTVSGIPETQWNNLTLDVSFSNNSSFILAPGLNGSFTKDFSDDNLDLFLVGTNGSSNEAEVGFLRTYTVAMTTTMSVTDNTIDTFGVYPNPAHDMVYVPNELSNSSVEIFNINGQLVHSDTKLSSTMNVSHLSRGMYIMKFNRGNKEYAQKLVVE